MACKFWQHLILHLKLHIPVQYFQGKKDVRIAQRPRPITTDDTDAIIHVTTTTVCCSDLHMCKILTNKLSYCTFILIRR